MRKSRLLWLAVFATSLAFFVGIWAAMDVGFDRGSVYAPFSTLRADALGARAYYESLALLPGLNVRRNLQPIDQIPSRPLTLMLLGARTFSELDNSFAAAIDRLTASGARVVVAFAPRWPNYRKANVNEISEESDEKKSTSGWSTRAGVHAEIAETPKYVYQTGVPRETAMTLIPVATEWSVKRTLNGKPVVIERPWKKGSVVIITDSWPLSNDALFTKRNSAELAWIAGSNREIVFDESQLGTVEGGSIVGLIRRYNLHGLVFAAIALAILFFWSRSLWFMPQPELNSREVSRGRASEEGMLALLERSVPTKRLLDVCVQEHNSRHAASAIELPGDTNAKNIAEIYNAITRRLEQERHPWKQRSNS